MDYLLIIVVFVLAIVALKRVSSLEQKVLDLRHEIAELLERKQNVSHSTPQPLHTEKPGQVDKKPTVLSTNEPSPRTDTPSGSTVHEPEPSVQNRPLIPPPPGVLYTHNTHTVDETTSPIQPSAPKEPVAAMPTDESSGMRKEHDAPVGHSRTREEWEILIGGNLFNRIGAVALVIAIALFLKYAFDNGWIHPSPVSKVVSGLLIGIALLWGGARSHRHGLVIFAQGIIGAGIGALYLSVYASYAFFHLVPITLAIPAMFVVTLVTFWQAYRYDSPVIAILGWIGGFLTPIILRPLVESQLAANGAGICMYLFVFNIGILTLQLRKDRWKMLEPLALGSTYLLYFIWFVNHQHAHFLIPLVSLTVLWAQFAAVQTYRCLRNAEDDSTFHLALFLCNTTLYSIAVYLLLHEHHDISLPFVLLGISLLHVLIGELLVRRQQSTPTSQGALFAAIVFLALATREHFHGFTLTMLWSIEAAVLAFCGVRCAQRVIWKTALLLLAASIIALFLTDGALAFTPLSHYTVVLNIRCLAYIVLAVCIAGCAIVLTRWEKYIEQLVCMLHWAWITIIFVLLTIEVNDTFRQLSATGHEHILPFIGTKFMVLAVVWTLYSLPLVQLGSKKSRRMFVYAGVGALCLGVLAIAIRGYTYQPLDQFTPIINLRAIPFILVIIGLAVQAGWLRRDAATHPWLATFAHLAQVLGAVLLFELLSVETIDFCRKGMLVHGTIIRQQYSFAIFAMLPIIWTVYAFVLTRYATRRQTIAIPLTICAVVAQWLAFLVSATVLMHFYPIERFYPGLNLRVLAFIVVMLGLLGQSHQLRRYENTVSWIELLRVVVPSLICILLFELVTIEIVDFYRQLGASVQSGIDMPFHRNMVLAISWMVLASLMLYTSLRKQYRDPIYIALSITALAVIWGVFNGMRFSPIAEFIPIMNIRALTLVSTILILGFDITIVRKYAAAWMPEIAHALVGPMRIVVALLIFELCTVETWDYYSRTIALGSENLVDHLRELRQTAISVVWLIYSIMLLGYGIWRQLRPLRLIAIAVFLLTICKICLYYIFMPNMLYRIISFAGLGITLLVTSFLYQRYKSVILASTPDESVKTPSGAE